MSYILDALQRANAERERAHVPGLHTPQHTQAPPPGPLRTAQRPVLAWLALALALGLAVAWWSNRTQPTPAPATSAPALAPQPPEAPPARPAPPSTNTALLAPPTTAPRLLRPSAPEGDAPRAQPRNPAAADPPARTAPADNQPHSTELPAVPREQQARLHISGSTYSENPSLRMLIANGNVVQEGQDIAPGWVLERIEPRSAVLNQGGQRYRLSY